MYHCTINNQVSFLDENILEDILSRCGKSNRDVPVSRNISEEASSANQTSQDESNAQTQSSTEKDNDTMINRKDGEPGKDGRDGEPGKDGKDGKDGEPGRDGKDGKDGEPGKDGNDGKDGRNGEPGKDGKDGKDGRDGEPGKDGKDGEPGKDGKRDKIYNISFKILPPALNKNKKVYVSGNTMDSDFMKTSIIYSDDITKIKGVVHIDGDIQEENDMNLDVLIKLVKCDGNQNRITEDNLDIIFESEIKCQKFGLYIIPLTEVYIKKYTLLSVMIETTNNNFFVGTGNYELISE